MNNKNDLEPKENLSKIQILKNRKKELLKELAKLDKLEALQNQRQIEDKMFQKFKKSYLFYGQFEIDQLDLEELKSTMDVINDSGLSKLKKEKIIQLLEYKIENYD